VLERAVEAAAAVRQAALADAGRAQIEPNPFTDQAVAAERRAREIELEEDPQKDAPARALEAIAAVKAEVDPIAEQLRDASARHAKLTADADTSDLAANECARQGAVFEFWQRGFSGEGLPSWLLDEFVPVLTERTNHYLGILTDGDIRIRFDTTSRLKSGDVRDRFAVELDVENMGDVRASGGQGRKIALAGDLALMECVADRERAAVDLLLLDEVLDGLDAVGKARVVDLLSYLRTRRSSVYVISHDPEISGAFERRIHVVRRGGVSRIETDGVDQAA
jgi:DNA repair exonuclease SbcCD ATPase subunit